MSSPPDPSAHLRYFLAGLKPLGRPVVWMPISLTLLAGLGFWQYRERLNARNPNLENPDNPPTATQWIGTDPIANERDAAVPSDLPVSGSDTAPPSNDDVDPITGFPIPLNAPPALSTQPGNKRDAKRKDANSLAENNSNTPSQPLADFPLPTATSNLNPFNSPAPAIRSPDRQSRPQLFTPLLPDRSNSSTFPNSLSPASPSPANGSSFVPRRPPQSTLTLTPANPADSPLRRALDGGNNVTRAASPQEPPNSPIASPFLPSTVTPPAIQPRSIYTDAYRPPAYQPYGAPSNATNRQDNNSNRNIGQSPASQTPGFNNYGDGQF
jgi:hypothetical protein